MPELSAEYIKARLLDISKQSKQKELEADKYNFYMGAVKPILEKSIKKEFKLPESISGLMDRLLPLNIMKKVVDKLSAVFLESPVRDVMDGNESDIELMQEYEDCTMINVRMKEVERAYEINNKVLAEVYVDSEGKPAIRVLPAHTYYAFSSSVVSPEKPDCIFKIAKHDAEKNITIYAVWTDERFLIIDQNGLVQSQAMYQLGNPEGINPYGKMPFVYCTESTLGVEPIQDDDLFSCSLSVPILLTDLSFGTKYQAWSLIWTVGYEGDIPTGPGAVLHLQPDPTTGVAPSVNQIKPTIDVASTLSLIESIVSYLLSSKGLKTSSLAGKMSIENAVSGVAKMIDSAEIISINKDKQAMLLKFEHNIWHFISKYAIPVWRKSGVLNIEYNKEFSKTFDVSIQLKEPRALITESEQIDLAKKKIDAGFSTLRRELMALYPDMNESEINALIAEIKEEKAANVSNIANEMMANAKPENKVAQEDMPEEKMNGSEGKL